MINLLQYKNVNFFLVRESAAWHNDFLIQFWIMFAMLIFVSIIMALVVSLYKVLLRKHEHVYCLQLLKFKDKITDEEEVEYLKKIEPKLRGYAERWWYNNIFSFLSRRKKMRKIAKKYNLEIQIWNY